MRKFIAHALGGSDPLPGTDSQDFLENWLDHGTGGTCWPSSNALYETAKAAGFEVSRCSASMWDTGEATHGTVIATVEGRDYAVDSSILTVRPVPLEKDAVYVERGPLNPVEVEWTEGTFMFWFEAPNMPVVWPCRLLERGVAHAFYAERYEWSRTNGPFNEKLYVRRNFPDRCVVISGNRKWERTPHGQTEELLGADALVAELIERHGYSQGIVGQWIDAGGLEKALTPSEGSRALPELDRLPPSRRPTGSRED